MLIKPAYYSSRLNDSTYLIIQDDKYVEFPYIYVKLYPSIPLAVVIDTGCGPKNASHRSARPADLKEYIEDEILDKDGTYEYMVICTHCHFDHIGGIESFASAGAEIVASGNDKDFLSPENLPENSRCKAFNTKTPRYKITNFTTHGKALTFGDKGLNLHILHTPGHTPDSLAIYDARERWLFTGDTLYHRLGKMPWGEAQDGPIVFGPHGDWRQFILSLINLRIFITEMTFAGGSAIRLGAGHITCDGDAKTMVDEVLDFAKRVQHGEVPVLNRVPGDELVPGGSLGDGIFVIWQDKGNPKYSLCAPERFEREFKEHRERS